MCKAPKVRTPPPEPPKILVNPFADPKRNVAGVIAAQRTGRTSLRIPLQRGLGVGFSGRGVQTAAVPAGAPQRNVRTTRTGVSNLGVTGVPAATSNLGIPPNLTRTAAR
jgi:hypothetical protein